jgi:hypothetical protein
MKKLIFAALAVCFIAACEKTDTEELAELFTPAVTYIKADGNEDDTKGSVSGTDASFSWNTGDRIAVWAGGYKVSDALESTYDGQASATFAFSGDNAVTEADRADFAIFPASLVWDGSAVRPGSASAHTAAGLKLTLPASYTLDEVLGEVSPTPMIATNAPNGSLAFKALCPLLRVTVAGIPSQTKRIEFCFNGLKVQGEFTMTGVTPATTAIAASAASGSDDTITVTMAGNSTWQNSLVINLPLPTGSYGNITVTAYDALSGGNAVLTLTKPIKASGWTPTRKASRKITAAMPFFTGANGKKLAFAPGNLQATYNGSSWSWAFAANQYDFIGKNPGNTNVSISPPYISANGTVDLFGWVGANSSFTEAAAYGITFSKEETGYGNIAGESLKYDWGSLVTGPGTWRTPTGGENGDWDIILAKRTVSSSGLPAGENSAAARYVNATVAGNRGLIIFPDAYSHPSGVTVDSSNPVYNAAGAYTQFSVSASDWAKMEGAGAVFLPAAGYRDGNTVANAFSHGYYWSATGASAKNAYDLHFSDGTVTTYSGDPRFHGRSVRLVREVY